MALSSFSACTQHFSSSVRSPSGPALQSRPRVVCHARSGYDQRPKRNAAYDGVVFDDDMAAAPRTNNRAGGQGGYAQPGFGGQQQQQQQQQQGGGYRQRRGPRQDGGDGPKQPIDYRPRRNRGVGGAPDAEGRPFRGQDGGQRDGEQGGSWQRASPEELAMRQELNSAVRSARGWRELGEVLQAKGQQMDAENITQIMSRVARDKPPRNSADEPAYERLCGELLGYILAKMGTLRPKQTATAIKAMAGAQLFNQEVADGLVAKATSQMGNFAEGELLSVLTGIRQWGYTPSPEFWAEFEGRTGPKVQAMKFNDIIYLLKQLYIHNAVPAGRPWMDTAFAALEKAALTLPTTQEAAKALERPRDRGVDQSEASTSAAGAEAGQGAPAAPAGRGQRQGQRFQRGNQQQERDPADVGPRDYEEACMVLANIASTTGQQPPQSLIDAVLSRQLWRVSVVSSETATKLLYSVSNFTARPSPQWFATIMEGLARRDRSWRAEEVSNVCLYLSRYLQQVVTPNLASRLTQFVTDNKVELGPNGVTNVVYLLGMSGYKPADRWLDDVLIYLKTNMAACSVESLEMLYNSLPLLGSGYRLNEVLTEAANRYNAAAQATAVDGATDANYEAQAV